MPTGRVKWFNNAKGYGFILPDEGGDDLFAHYSSINMEGYKTLKAGQPVGYEVLDGPKGSHAINITSQENQESEGSQESEPNQEADQIETDSEGLQDSDELQDSGDLQDSDDLQESD
jgi:CspA family cold shock protein